MKTSARYKNCLIAAKTGKTCQLKFEDNHAFKNGLSEMTLTNPIVSNLLNQLAFIIVFICPMYLAHSQIPGAIKGQILDSKTKGPIGNVIVAIGNSTAVQLTNAKGEFALEKLAVGKQILQIKCIGYEEQLLQINITPGKTIDLGIILLEIDITAEQQISIVTLSDDDLGDDNSGSENTAGILQATRDAFQQAAAFNWSPTRFRIRGLDSEYSTTMINGIAMNKIYDGRPQWSNWGGLNDVTRNQEFTMGSEPSDYTFGNLLGTQEINVRASIYRKGSRISFSGTNTNYSWRLMGTHASGLSAKNWAFIVSTSKRWAKEGYFEGTNYSANSLFLSIEKRLSDFHSLNFTAIYAKNSRAKNSPNSAEINDMAGYKYNSYWGWDNGQKRNSRVKLTDEPITMLNHYWKIGQNISLQTNVLFQTGHVGNTRIDFQDAKSPDPTYYRNLPSYYLSLYEKDPTVVPENAYHPGGLGGVFTPDLMGAMSAKFISERQINWKAMYAANMSTLEKNSLYVLYEDRTDDDFLVANSIFSAPLSENIIFNCSVSFKSLKSHNFQNLLDLMGGNFYKDVDTFGQGNQIQPDLNNPDKTVREGDSFGYNYNLYAQTIDAFTQSRFSYKMVDFYLAQFYSRLEYYRQGLFRNGYYPLNSFGKSKTYAFEDYGFKGGLTYKVSGQKYLNLNLFYATKAPSLRNVFPNSRLNNNTIDGISSERIMGMDVGYILRLPNLKTRISGYFSKTGNATKTSFYYAEGVFQDIDGSGGDQSNAFVAETVTKIDREYIGLECGFEYQLTSTIKLLGSAGLGQYTYSNNPIVLISQDALATKENTNPVVNFGNSRLKNYKLAGTPQKAYSIGIEYRDPKFWWVGANFNLLADNYLDIAPLLRTDNFATNTSDINGFPYPEFLGSRSRELLHQEKLPTLFLGNLVGGKSWILNRKSVGFFASISNIFNVKYKTGGFEQVRNASYRELNQDVSSGNPAFAPRYFYGYGRTFFTNFYVSF